MKISGKKSFKDHLSIKLQKRKKERKLKKKKGKNHEDPDGFTDKGSKFKSGRIVKNAKLKNGGKGNKSHIGSQKKRPEAKGFQPSTATGARLAQLQEYVNREAGKMAIQKKKDKVKSKDEMENAPKKNLIKDRRRLQVLQEGQSQDDREIKQLMKKMNWRDAKLINKRPEFNEEFADIIADIEDGSMSRSKTYSEENKTKNSFMYDSDFDSDESDDMSVNIDEEKENLLSDIEENDDDGTEENDDDMEENDDDDIEENDDDGTEENDDDMEENDDDDIEENDDDDIDEMNSENENSESEEEKIKGGGFFDMEAEESSEDEESNDEKLIHDETKEYELAFEGGGFVNNGVLDDIDLFSSNSDDDTNLEDFVVDDDVVEYESSEGEPLSPKKKKKKRRRIVSCESDDLENRERNESIDDIDYHSQARGSLKALRIESDPDCDLEDHMEHSKSEKKYHDASNVNGCVGETVLSSLQASTKKRKYDTIANALSDEDVAKTKKKKKKKLELKKKGVHEDIDISRCNGQNLLQTEIKYQLNVEENGLHGETDIVSHAEQEKNIKKKKKKKRKEVKAVDSIVDGNQENEVHDNVLPLEDHKDTSSELISPSIPEKKKKKKKKKKATALCEKEEQVEIEESLVDRDEHEVEDSVIKEDIYGRLRDKDGNIVEDKKTGLNGKYIPPALRKLMALNVSEKKKEQLAALKRNLKGLLNRLAESNMAGIARQIEGYYHQYSHNDMNECLSQLLNESLVISTSTPERLVQEHALLIAVLSANVGNEIGAQILTDFVINLNDQIEKTEVNIEDKNADNLLNFIANLFNFKVVAARLIYDILQRLADVFKEKEVELILMVLRTVGFSLRKEDPMALKTFITQIQSQAAQCQAKNGETYSRICFMLEVINSIKNNNPSKMPNYDPSHVEHLKKIMKGLIHKGKTLSPLFVTLDDVLKSKFQGRWWIVGSAWSGGLKENAPQEDVGVYKTKLSTSMEDKFSDRFKKKAAKLQLTRPPRINIMYIITEGSEDYLDAFDKLLQLKLPNNQEQDMFHVILLCCQKGKVYNDFFAYLACRMCKFEKRYKRLLQFAVWQKFEEMENFKPNEVENLAKFLVHLISEDGLNVTILKTLSFVEADAQLVYFVRIILKGLLLHTAGTDRVLQIFSQVSVQPELKLFCQSLRVFIAKFLLSKKKNKAKYTVLHERSQEILELLSSRGGIVL